MASVLVAFVLVFVASLQFVTTPVYGTPHCDPAGWSIFGSCTKYSRIEYHGSKLSCIYYCGPNNAICYKKEKDREPCLNFDSASKGRCFRGRCYTPEEYESMRPPHYRSPPLDCPKGHDYIKNSQGIRYGCQYYCKRGRSKHPYPREVDGSDCLIPSTAANGICWNGECIRRRA
ncbi:uncharacterized protein LOC135398232 isoform X2 [Ornithodoros turicata]|uniref:uncharacterized protein LOC135398232 isoform X2 n=1 Tax=Ornithodoros turicata TaxID=34597 RepID=UPI003138DDB6